MKVTLDVFQILPGDPVQRGTEARALLVALASAIDLRGSTASDFSVKIICRAARTCLLNAVASLRLTYANQERDSLERAERDLQVRP
jgi:uncharacterized protein (DUF1778 family)